VCNECREFVALMVLVEQEHHAIAMVVLGHLHVSVRS